MQTAFSIILILYPEIKSMCRKREKGPRIPFAIQVSFKQSFWFKKGFLDSIHQRFRFFHIYIFVINIRIFSDDMSARKVTSLRVVVVCVTFYPKYEKCPTGIYRVILCFFFQCEPRFFLFHPFIIIITRKSEVSWGFFCTLSFPRATTLIPWKM